MIKNLINHKMLIAISFFFTTCVICFYTSKIFALSEVNRVAELRILTEEATNMVTTLSYLFGAISLAIGLYALVALQNIKMTATAVFIGLIAIKGVGFFTTTCLI